MTIYTHKVRRSCVDGWGRSLPHATETLGVYETSAKAEIAKQERDATPVTGMDSPRGFDVGSSWIESQEVQ